MMYALDTDILTLAFRLHERVTARLEAADRPVVITTVNRIEQLNGRFDAVLTAADAAQLLRAQTALAATEQFLSKYEVLPFDDRSAARFDVLRSDKKLKKVGRKDLLIASICLIHGCTLATRNTKDFGKVPGLRIENWAD